MTVFACTGCDCALTAPVCRVALPAHTDQRYGYGLLGALMEPGTYAVEPDSFGPPWRRWAEIGPAEAEALGVYAPRFSLSFGPRGAVVIAPGDVRGTVFIPGRLDGYCCGLDGRDGPNLACGQCGLPVATRIDDCGLWQAIWLDPNAVHPVDNDAHPCLILDWQALPARRPGVPPVEAPGQWNPRWLAAVARSLAHVVAVSGGARVTVPDGLIADTFRPALDALLPSGPAKDALLPSGPAKALALAGPDLPAFAADIALVPRHPQTGELWTPCGTMDVAPLSWDVWAYLAFHHDRRPVPAKGAMPKDALRDDPPSLIPFWTFRPDADLFAGTLSRLPEVRQPWLRQIYDRVSQRPYPYPFW